jgi:hypothetical protein
VRLRLGRRLGWLLSDSTFADPSGAIVENPPDIPGRPITTRHCGCDTQSHVSASGGTSGTETSAQRGPAPNTPTSAAPPVIPHVVEAAAGSPGQAVGEFAAEIIALVSGWAHALNPDRYAPPSDDPRPEQHQPARDPKDHPGTKTALSFEHDLHFRTPFTPRTSASGSGSTTSHGFTGEGPNIS